jgi:16S rRNA (adenine1518-N6/adenine1519-N6)-dimethyltransferase
MNAEPYRHTPRKRFGQHFLHDPGILQRIVAAVAPPPGATLFEIGPRRGARTVPLLRAAGSLHVVEIDRDLLQPLADACAPHGRLQLHHADALQFDFRMLTSEPRGLRVVGNLPYNISTPLLFHLLDQQAAIRDMHFMLQKEVVERMAAAPGTSDYGRLTVMLQARCRVEPLLTIGRGAFRPPPRVESAFVRLVPYDQPPVPIHDFQAFARLVTQAFGRRRKTLRNALQGLLETSQIEAAGVDPQLRPERLALAQFAALANQLAGTARGV